MKTLITFLILSFLIITQVTGQEPPKIKFGKVPEEDIKMKTYLPDTTANAIILFDDGQSIVSYNSYENDFKLEFERFVRIKILKQEGTSWGNFAISLYSYNSTREDILDLDGFTFNMEGEKIEKNDLKKESIFRERENKYREIVKLSMPKVKVGSVIDLRYKISSPLLWNLRTWKFQYTIPVKWSQYEITYPEYYIYNQSNLGYHRLNTSTHTTESKNINYTTTTESQPNVRVGSGRGERVSHTISYQANVYKYAASEVPAMKEEPYLTTLENYTTRIKFELASIDFTKIGGQFKNYTNSWKTIIDQLLDDEDFGGQIKSDNFSEDIAGKLIAGKSTEMEKAVAIYDHIQHTMKWDETNAYTPSKSLKKSYNEKNGNSADINLTLLVMLRKAGLTVHPVLLSTRSHGMLTPTSPTVSDFNYTIVQVIIDNKPMLFDATEPNLPAGMIPFRCLNINGMLIKKDAPEEIPLTNTSSRTNTSVVMELAEGKLVGNMVTRTSGQNAFDFREEVKDAGGSKEYFEKMKNNSSDIQYLGYSFANLDSIYLPLDKKYKFSIENPTENENTILYINPILSERLQKNPFTSPTREYPVDYGSPVSVNYTLNIKIPEGYLAEELPKNKTYVLDDKAGSYSYQIGQTNGQIILSTRFKIEKSLFLPINYEHLKTFYDLIVAKESEQIILKKSN